MSHIPRTSTRMAELAQIASPYFQVAERIDRLTRTSNTCDFAFGNPQDMPLPGYEAALQKWSTPDSTQYFAYFGGEDHAKSVVARTLKDRSGRPYSDEDIIMTNGAFGALTVMFNGLVESGDEVIYMLPPWFFYAGMIHNSGATAVPVRVRPDNHDLDIDAIAAAINEKTKAVLVNSPNNPTGKIYPPATLQALSEILQSASERYGHPIYLFSDEAYNRILLDNQEFPSPTSYYPYSLLVYTYAKTLLNPGERLGYLAISPEMPERETMRMPLFVAKAFAGLATPNSLLMHAIEDIEELCIDINQLRRRRDRLIGALSEIGYQVHRPEGTFYLMPKSPIEDDWAFFDILAAQDIICLPGTVVDLPGHFRLSLTANDEMIERSIRGFAKAFEIA